MNRLRPLLLLAALLLATGCEYTGDVFTAGEVVEPRDLAGRWATADDKISYLVEDMTGDVRVRGQAANDRSIDCYARVVRLGGATCLQLALWQGRNTLVRLDPGRTPGALVPRALDEALVERHCGPAPVEARALRACLERGVDLFAPPAPGFELTRRVSAH